jgi:polysaccharide chain length determinant protein (PEP-CTERM system associated)
MNHDFEAGNSLGLEFKDLWAIVIRRRWSLLGPFFLLGWLGFAVAHRWPYLYRSEALVLVVEQRVPEQYVTPNVVSNPQDRLQSMTQQILSRTRLETLIEEFKLYPWERAHDTIEDAVDKMRKDIDIQAVQTQGRPGELTAFRISYSAKGARVAQQVTNELTSLFIEENLEARTQASIRTTAFLESQLEAARKDLAQQEQRESEFKRRYLGELPEQEMSNLGLLNSLEAQLHSSTDGLERTMQQKIYYQSMKNEYEAIQQSTEGRLGTDGSTTPVAAADAQLKELRKQLEDLRVSLTPRHPDIIKLEDEISEWEGLKRRLEVPPDASATKSDPAAGTRSSPAVNPDPALAEIDSRLKSIDAEVRDREKETDAIRARIREVQSHLSLTPLREQEFAEITRAYENSREYYQSLLHKKLQSELATNLEKRQQGEQFRILDPASLPQKPSEPSPLEIILIGWALGLCGGIGLMAAREIRDKTLRGEWDVADVPVLVRIPTLRTGREQTRLRWFRGFEAASVTLLVALSAVAGVFTYLRG